MNNKALNLVKNPAESLSYYKDKTILVTGGTGYLGSAIIKALDAVSCRVTALGSKEADIRDKGVWKKHLKGVDVVFHFAAQTSSRVANDDPLADLDINVLPAASFIETCQNNRWKPDIIFSGTVTQVGVTDSWPVNEGFRDKPATVYDVNKLTAEKCFQYYGSHMDGRSVVLRLPNLYGPGPKSSRPDRGILNLMVRQALKGESLTVYGDGTFIRDYTYIDDVANAFLAAGANIDALNGNYYVIGSGTGHSIKDMAAMIKGEVFRRTGKDVSVEHVAPPDDLSPIEFRNFIADSSAFSEKTGWCAEVSLNEGINRTIDFFLEENTR